MGISGWHLLLQRVQREEHQQSLTSSHKPRVAYGYKAPKTELWGKESYPDGKREVEQRSGWGSTAGMPGEPAEGGEWGREHPVTGQPLHPASSSTGREACPACFTGVQGTGGPTGCWGSPPKHVCSRWARTERQPIWNIIYNNNNNNINNIRTSGSVFSCLPFGWRQSIRVTWQCVSVSNLAPAQLLQWLRDRHFQGHIPAPNPGWPHRCPTTDSRST